MTKTMNLTKIILACCLILACLFGFTACNNKGAFKDNPNIDALVQGNGTNAVVKGDYVYYTNGFMGVDTVGDTNHDGNITYSALYRTKLVDGKIVEKDKKKDDDGKEIFDETMGIKYTDILVSKVCGFEYSSLFIFDDYIYYTTPNNQKDNNLNVCNKLIDFCRIKIDKSSKPELLYTTVNPGVSVDYTMYKMNNVVYLIIMDKVEQKENNDEPAPDKIVSKLVVKSFGKQNKTYSTPDDIYVDSFAKANYTTNKQQICNIDSSVYFTYIKKDISTNNFVAKLDLAKMDKLVDVYNESNIIYSMKQSCGDKIYYTKNTAISNSAYLYYNSLIGDFNATQKQLTNNAYDKYLAFSTSNGGAILFDKNNSAIYKKNNLTDSVMVKLASGVTVTDFVCLSGNYLYYIADSALYKLDYINETKPVAVINDSATAKMERRNNVAICGDKIFYLKEYASGDNKTYYMHMINSSIKDDNDKVYDHFIGVLEEKDYIKK